MKPAFNLPTYDLVGELGTGGTACVYKISEKSNGHSFALKTNLNNDDINPEDFLRLAQREYHLTHNLRYPGIVRLYSINQAPPYHIILEFCPGRTLERVGKIESIPAVLNLLSSIAVNLEYLRLLGIVHADLKPDNIFLPQDESIIESCALFYTKLSDFSLGQFVHEEPSARSGMGTVGFMAPEVIGDNRVSHKSDYFALGVIAYQILSGQHPFIGDDADPVVINGRIKEETPTDIRNLRSDTSDKLAQIIVSLLEKQPEKRPENGWKICQLLEEAGATYPYKKALQPGYLILPDASFEENIVRLHGTDREKKRLGLISNYSSEALRTIVSYNHIRKNISYDSKSFTFSQTPLLPYRQIQNVLSDFMLLPYTAKKRTIEESLTAVGSYKSVTQAYTDSSPHLIKLVLPYLLTSKTIRQISLRLGKKAEASGRFVTAADLYLQAGKLEKAENSAYQAAVALKKENKVTAAIELIDRVLEFARLKNRLFETASLLMLKGDYLKDSGETVRAEAVYFTLIDLYQDKTEDLLLAEAYKDLGDLYRMKQLPDKGIKALEKALAIYRLLGNELEISHTYNNLCNIYIVKHDYKQAIKYARQALRLQRRLEVEHEIASTVNNLAVIYNYLGRLQQTSKLLNISYELKKKIGDKAEIAFTMNNLGYCYYLLGDNMKAVHIVQEALAINKEIGSKQQVLINLENLTTFMFQAGHIKASIGHLKEAIPLAEELDDVSHLGIFKLSLGAVLIRMGKIREAQEEFKQVEMSLSKIKDYYLESQYLLEKAKLAFYLNQIQTAEVYVADAKKAAELSGDQHVVSQVRMMSAQLSPEELTESQSAEPALDSMSREEKVRYLYAVHAMVKAETIRMNEKIRSNITTIVSSMQEDIEHSHALILYAEILLESEDKSQAAATILQAKKVAQSRGMQFDFLQSIILEGRLEAEKKEYERCYSLYRQALQIAKSIAEQIDSEKDRTAFQQKKEIIFLVTEIKKLASVIGNKKEQVV